MRRGRRMAALVAVAMLGIVVPPSGAGAETSGGSVDLTFDVDAVLPQFPCPSSCTTSLEGAALVGTGNVSGGTPVTNGSFSLLGASITGSAGYIEFEFPFCPAGGSADGVVSLSGGDVTGPAYQPTGAGAFSLGNMTSATASGVRFEYIRAGAGSSVVLTPLAGGSMNFHADFPDGSAVDWASPVVGGGGAAVFTVDPADAQRVALACVPGAPPATDVRVQVIGNVNLALGGT